MSRVYARSVLFINGQPVAHAGPGGQASAQEECWANVGGVRVNKKYTNLALAKDLKGTTTKSFYNGYPLATIKSYTKTSYGDEDSEGGVKSGTKQQRMFFLTASPNVYYEGNPLCFHSNKVILNDENSEVTEWIQPASAARAIQELRSDPIEDLPDPKVLNIELIRSPEQSLTPAKIHQYLYVQHEETGHLTYTTYAVFKAHSKNFIWHDPKFREGHYQVYEIYEKSVDELIRIPLGRIHTADKDVTQPGLKLVPITFKRYTDMQKSEEAAAPLLIHSYIYLFKDGHLWREFEVNPLGNLNEVDLSVEYLNPKRPANAELKQGILLPIEDLEGKHEFKIAVSRIQWSWDYIFKLGGVDLKDPRFKDKKRVPITPDSTLIAKRLRKIKIESLISQGANPKTIPDHHKETALLEAHKNILPPSKNLAWIAAEEKLNLSKGMVNYSDHLTWISEVYPVDKRNKLTPVPGSALILLNDPMGQMHLLAESVNIQQHKFKEFSKEHGHPYTLALMVGQIKETLVEKDYLEITRESARLRHINIFESKREAHKSYLKLATEELVHFFNDAIDEGQWLDFDQVKSDLFEMSIVTDKYSDLLGDLFTALNLSQDGLDFIKQEVKKSHSQIMHEAHKISLGERGQLPLRFLADFSGVLAASLEPESLNELVHFIDKALGVPLEVKIDEVPLESVVEWQTKTTVHETKYAGVYQIKTEKVVAFVPEKRPPSLLKIKTLIVEGAPFHEISTVINKNLRHLIPATAVKLRNLADKVDRNEKFRVALGALSVFNIGLHLRQMEKLKNQEDDDAQARMIFYAEILKNILIITELTLKNVGTSKKMIFIGRGIATKDLIKSVGIYGGVFAVLIDTLYTGRYLKSGEYELAFSHFVGIVSGGIFSTWLIAEGGTLFWSLFGLAGLFLGIISVALIAYFSKTPFEQWIFDGYWGRRKRGKDKLQHSIEKFHLLICVVELKSIRRFFDEKILARLKDPYMQRGLAYVEHKGLYFDLRVPFKGEHRIKVRILSYRKSGTFQLEDGCLTLVKSEHTEEGACWTLSIPRFYFEDRGLLGKLELECYEEATQSLMGRDAYEFSRNFPQTEYSFKKVRCEILPTKI